MFCARVTFLQDASPSRTESAIRRLASGAAPSRRQSWRGRRDTYIWILAVAWCRYGLSDMTVRAGPS
jgi:hypothetical protein